MIHRQNDRLRQVNLAIFFCFLGIFLLLIYWGIFRASAILVRDDNPRLVEAELRIQRGRIYDRNMLVLADTVGPPQRLERRYPLAAVGPAIGYYSFRHGTAGIEQEWDGVLRGESDDPLVTAQRQLLHQSQIGNDIRLTLDAVWQIQADALLGDWNGAVVLLEFQEQDAANILALVSHPGYDPNRLDERFDQLLSDENAPLVNRAVQGQYQPGMVLQPFLLAAALDEQILELDERVENPGEGVWVNGRLFRCVFPPANMTWEAVIQAQCPAPMQTLAAVLGPAGLNESFERFGFFEQPPIFLDLDFLPSDPLRNPQTAVIGQENLLLTPIQVARAWLALAGDGRLPELRLVQSIKNSAGRWDVIPGEQIISSAVTEGQALAIHNILPKKDGIIYFSTAVLSGPAGEKNSWYLGMAPANNPATVVIVLIENTGDTAVAEKIGQSLLLSYHSDGQPPAP